MIPCFDRWLPRVALRSILCVAAIHARAADHTVYDPAGVSKGKHIVLLAADDEYRSEEGLPMLAKILSQRHGFRCTVGWSVDEHGFILPTERVRIGGAAALDSADAIVVMFRWRIWTPEGREKFKAAVNRGVPIIGLRTSTHTFDKEAGEDLFHFGKNVLGERWLSHWGRHKVEANRGVIEPANAAHPVLRGVKDVFANSDVYEAYPPADATVLVRGQVLQGMNPADPPATYRKKRLTDQVEQGVNDPMMPVAWVRAAVPNTGGTTNKVFMTTMGAATDLSSEGLRRLVVNGVHWCLGLEVPSEADVTMVGEYAPTMYGFDTFKTGVKPEDHALNAAQ